MSEIGNIIGDSGFKFNKRYGQNFITDTNLLDAIVRDAGISGGTVLEIGAGAGTLTAALARAADRVVSYEIDTSLMPVLSRTLAGLDGRVEVVFRDVMKESDAAIDAAVGDDYALVANLPYYITTPVIMRFIERSNAPRAITVMVQKEVGDRLCAAPNTADYGAITASVALAGSAEITRIVPRTLFYPQPKVDSCIVRISLDSRYADVDKPLVRKIIRCAFAMRRKTLVNNLMSGLSLSRESAVRVIEGIGLDARVRGETLSVEQFVRLAGAYSDLTCKE
ncbi:MAG: 16S rRNA (adenine(1518)-N(6)/adenine(1519)-N(6))-dimethyltransferase RsmA [Clostridia bacterium]|nr:16S rRNA (adenine(1518)-N(6)/adenine(1519)-N(6))-dimethyltransferase RsmA [Clostridia bacterium]